MYLAAAKLGIGMIAKLSQRLFLPRRGAISLHCTVRLWCSRNRAGGSVAHRLSVAGGMGSYCFAIPGFSGQCVSFDATGSGNESTSLDAVAAATATGCAYLVGLPVYLNHLRKWFK